jgi:hypothetical protein
MTFDRMQSEVSLNLAGKAPAPDRLKLWVNYAIQDLATEHQFDELRLTESFPILDGVTEYGEPEGMLGVVDIKVNGKSLRRARRLYTVAENPGQPLYYLRKDGVIVVWPEPDQGYSDDSYIEYMKIPNELTEPGEKSPFPAHWDVTIIQRATYHAMLAIGDVAVADQWLVRSRQQEDRKLTEIDVSADVPHEGLRVAWDWDDLVDSPPHIER